MARVIRSEQAQEDLEGILEYLDSQRTDAADRFATKFERTCELHAEHPQIGARSEEYAPNLRHFAVWNYAVFYRPIKDGIELIRIIQGARDIPRLFEQAQPIGLNRLVGIRRCSPRPTPSQSNSRSHNGSFTGGAGGMAGSGCASSPSHRTSTGQSAIDKQGHHRLPTRTQPSFNTPFFSRTLTR